MLSQSVVNLNMRTRPFQENAVFDVIFLQLFYGLSNIRHLKTQPGSMISLDPGSAWSRPELSLLLV